jgi:leucyl-tRNA synthetase
VKFDEPFTRLFTQGMLLNHIYYRRNAKGGKEYFSPDSVVPTTDAKGQIDGGRLADGSSVEYGGVGKMGKTEQNGVEPQDLVDKYGADTARLYVMFAGSPDDSAIWSDAGVDGAHRFLKRLWTFAQTQGDTVRGAAGNAYAQDADAAVKAARRDLHVTLKQANYDYERIQYNTVVSAGMKMLNTLEAVPADADGAAGLLREGLSILLRTLYPVIPHSTWSIWQDLKLAGEFGDLLDAPWPEVDAAALAQDEVELMLQVNGKLRGKICVPATADKAAIEAAARASAEVARYAGGAPVKKIVIVPGRLVNVVV